MQAPDHLTHSIEADRGVRLGIDEQPVDEGREQHFGTSMLHDCCATRCPNDPRRGVVSLLEVEQYVIEGSFVRLSRCKAQNEGLRSPALQEIRVVCDTPSQ